MPDFFEQAFPAGMSYERTFKIWGWRSCSYHLILEGIRKSTYWVTNGGPLSFPLTYCRQRSNMETDASPNTLPTCSTFSNKHFLLECLMKGPIIWNMKLFTGFFMRFFRSFLWHWDHENVIDLTMKIMWKICEFTMNYFTRFSWVLIS